MNLIINSIIGVMNKTNFDHINKLRMKSKCSRILGEEAGEKVADYIVRIEAQRATIAYSLFVELLGEMDTFKINRVKKMASMIPCNYIVAFCGCALYTMSEEWEFEPMELSEIDNEMCRLTIQARVGMIAFIDGLREHQQELNVRTVAARINQWINQMDQDIVNNLFLIEGPESRKQLTEEFDRCGKELIKIIDEYGWKILNW